MPAAFLMQQMEWRESLEDARSEGELDALDDEVMAAKKRMLAECARLLDEAGDAVSAVQQVRALMFVARFAQDVERRRDQLGQ